MADNEQQEATGGAAPPAGAAEAPVDLTVPASDAPESAQVLDPSVWQRYMSGAMTRESRIQLEQDVRDGIVARPEGLQLQETKARGLFGDIAEAVTGEEGQTDQSRAAGDWIDMPELNGLNMESFMANIGTLSGAGAPEVAQIIQAQFPDVKVEQDEKGNTIFTSPTDGKTYAVKKGLQKSDVYSGVVQAAEYLPTMAASTVLGGAAGSAATRTAIEGVQAAAGGSFDPQDIALEGLAGGAGILLERGLGASVRAVRRRLGKGATAAAVPSPAGATGAGDATQAVASPTLAPQDVPVAQAGPAPTTLTEVGSPGATTVVDAPPGAAAAGEAPPGAAGIAGQPGMGMDDLVGVAGRAGGGRDRIPGRRAQARAQALLAQEAAVNQETVEAAKRWGVQDYLQPDHISTGSAFQELAQAAKSVPGSKARQKEVEGLQQLGQAAVDYVEQLGTGDISDISKNVKTQMESKIAALKDVAGGMYDELRRAIKPETRVNPQVTIDAINQRLQEFGGDVSLLTQAEQQVLKHAEKEGGITYAALDEIRKRVLAAKTGKGAFKDTEQHVVDMLYKSLREDQAAIAGEMGVRELFEQAQGTAKVYIGMQQDMQALFGRELSNSIATAMQTKIKGATKGKADELAAFLSKIPADLRQGVVVGGLRQAFGKGTETGALNFRHFNQFYEGLAANEHSYGMIMKELPEGSRQRLDDLYKISKNVQDALDKRITTGRVLAQDQFKKADESIGRLYRMGRGAAAGVGALGAKAFGGSELMGAQVGGNLFDIATANGGAPHVQRADKILSTPEFMNAVMQQATDPKGVPPLSALEKITNTKEWKRMLSSLNKGNTPQDGGMSMLKAIFDYKKVENTDDNRNQAAF